MSRYNPLFVTAPARSGSTLLAMMLSAHRDAVVASDPFFPLFRSFRNAAIRHADSHAARSVCGPSDALQDHYFSDARIAAMDAIRSASLELPFEPAEWAQLLESMAERAAQASGDLVPFLMELEGARTYRAMFDRALDLVARMRGSEALAWTGAKEVWMIDFLEPLARAYPHARFIVLMRDPRAVVSSMLSMARSDPSQRAHALSYARHCRKFLAFIERFRADAVMSERLHVMTYERLIQNPEGTAHALCSFLGIDFDPQMLDARCYFDYSAGTAWTGNSTEGPTRGIDRGISDRWRTRMDTGARTTVELACWPDMTLLGYEEVQDSPMDAQEVLEFLVADDQRQLSWRSDFRQPEVDYHHEIARRRLLSTADAALDTATIRRSFLFEEVFDKLRKRRPAQATA
jgi:LPS sulfotransferase NodH